MTKSKIEKCKDCDCAVKNIKGVRDICQINKSQKQSRNSRVAHSGSSSADKQSSEGAKHTDKAMADNKSWRAFKLS